MGDQTQQTEQASRSSEGAPWAPTQPYMMNSVKNADALYSAGIGSKPNTMSMVVPFAQQTQQGLDQNQQYAQGAFSTMQKPLEAYSGMIDTLRPIAAGDFSNDKTFTNTVGEAQRAAAEQVNLSASGAGRYGGGVHQGAVAKSVADATNNAHLARQAWASNALQGFGNAMPGAFSAGAMPGQALQGIGASYEQLMANYLGDNARIQNELQNKPWEALERYNAVVSGAGRTGTQSSSQAVTPTGKPGTGQQLLGFGLSALGNQMGMQGY